MKKHFFFTFLLAFGCLLTSQSALAQQAAPDAVAATTLDEKTQKKVDKAMAELVKDRDRLLKDQARLDKDRAKYEKMKAKGQLSPNDTLKMERGLMKDQMDIDKLKKRINDNQALLDKYKQ